MLSISNMLIPVFILTAAIFTSAAPAPTKPAQAVVVGDLPDPAPVPLTIPPADPTPSIDCHFRYCESSTSWCYYWAGVTGYDVSLGPLPGETRTPLGMCDPATLPPGPGVTQPPAL